MTLGAKPHYGIYDCAFVWGRGDWVDCRFRLLLRNSVFPVAAPDFFRGLGRKPVIWDIIERMLIHDQLQFWWSAFRSAVEATDLNANAGRIYNQSSLCLIAAARGDGITIGDEVSARDYLESGRLTCPFSVRPPAPDAYFTATPTGVEPSEDLQLFLSWICEEAKSHKGWYAAYWADA